MKKQYLAIIFALTFASACTFNVGTGNSNTNAPASNANTANTSNSAPAQNANAPANAEKPKTASDASTPRPAKRFQFAKGADRASVTGSLNGSQDSQDYLIDLIDGQSLIITGKDASAELSVTDPKGKQVASNAGNCGETVVVDDTLKGDYKLRIKPCKGKQNINYNVEIAAGSGKEF